MTQLDASFRDPDAYMVQEGGIIYRVLNDSFKDDYEKLMESGLYTKLTDKSWLIAHEEVEMPGYDDAYKMLRPEQLPWISYGYEWSFEQLREAALLTLKVHRQALEFGMSLKDASHFNVQMYEGAMIFIDTGSFETYQDGTPWIAYKQFCEHFLAPLALMHYVDMNANQMLCRYLDGIPLDVVARMLPKKAKWNAAIAMHILMHAKAVGKYQEVHDSSIRKGQSISLDGQKRLVDSLYGLVSKLQPHGEKTQWEAYDQHTSYSEDGADVKARLIKAWFSEISPSRVIDLGCNDGYYSSLALPYANEIVTCDIDSKAIDRLWLERAKAEKRFYPIIGNLLNPTPAIGWRNHEREALLSRLSGFNADCVMALALMHHLCITGQISFPGLALFFHEVVSNYLIIEWVSAVDHQSQKLIHARGEQFAHYTLDNFLASMSEFFDIRRQEVIVENDRVLLLFQKK